MLAAPARYVSVSELYSTDEVELLLDEIRELEPTSCRGEDVQGLGDEAGHGDALCGGPQDFEIAGSGCGACGGGRSPAGTELTERSWDSHAQYLREPPRPPQPLAPVYCRPRYLLTAQGAATLLLAVCSISCGSCVWAAAGARLGGGGAAGAALRALQLGALSSALLHAAALAMRLSALHLLMPLDWDGLSALCCLWSACWLLGGGGALAHALLTQLYDAPAHHRDLLQAALGLALIAGATGLGVFVGVARARCAARRGGGAARGAYRAVPGAPPPAPSTSRAPL